MGRVILSERKLCVNYFAAQYMARKCVLRKRWSPLREHCRNPVRYFIGAFTEQALPPSMRQSSIPGRWEDNQKTELRQMTQTDSQVTPSFNCQVQVADTKLYGVNFLKGAVQPR
jgi:hypothetical protein